LQPTSQSNTKQDYVVTDSGAEGEEEEEIEQQAPSSIEQHMNSSKDLLANQSSHPFIQPQ